MKSTATLKRAPTARRGTRAEQADQTRRALIEAAAYVVGRHGYAETSVARITQRAKVAQGTFYNYFASRQEILDLLPPLYAERMLRHISLSLDPALRGLDREVARFEAYFDFFGKNIEGTRLVLEAPALVPQGYAKYYQLVTGGYKRVLQRSIERGEIRQFDASELDMLVDLLIAIRAGLTQQHFAPARTKRKLPSGAVETYRKFVGRALFHEQGGSDPAGGERAPRVR